MKKKEKKYIYYSSEFNSGRFSWFYFREILKDHNGLIEDTECIYQGNIKNLKTG